MEGGRDILRGRAGPSCPGPAGPGLRKEERADGAVPRPRGSARRPGTLRAGHEAPESQSRSSARDGPGPALRGPVGAKTAVPPPCSPPGAVSLLPRSPCSAPGRAKGARGRWALAPVPGIDGTLPGTPAAQAVGADLRGTGTAEPCPSRPSCRLPVPGGGSGSPPKPLFPLGCAHRGPSAAEGGAGAPVPRYTGAEGGTEQRAGARCGTGAALSARAGEPLSRRSPPAPPRPAPPRPAPPRRPGPPGPALPGRCRAAAAAERHGGRRRRLRGGQGRRCLRPGALRAAAAGGGADRQRGVRPDRVRLPGRGRLHEPARGPAALLHLQPQRGRLSLRHRHRRPRLPRLHLLLHGGRLFPPDQQHHGPQVPGPGRPRLLRSLDLPVVHRLLFLDQPVVLDAGRGCVHRSGLCPRCHHLQLLLHLLLGTPAHLRLQEVQNGGGGLCSKLRRPQPGGCDSLLQLSQHQPRELPAAALHAHGGGPGGLSAPAGVLSPGWLPRDG